jgi:hypothetical protein
MPFIRSTLLITMLLFVYVAGSSEAVADVFDDHTAYWLRLGVKSETPRKDLSMDAGARAKQIARSISSPCIVVHTDEDNWSKALVTWGLRKTADGRVPILMIERYVTYRGDRENLTRASGKEVMLFPGFGFDFDIGQVVPIGKGDDIQCVEKATIKPSKATKLWLLNGPATPEPDKNEAARPTAGAVIPSDFAGKWQVQVDGRWSGRLEFRSEGRKVFGRFISDDTKSVYEAEGKVAALPHNLKFEIELANANQSFDAFMWTKNKSKMAGIVTMSGRKLGFYAIRIVEEKK